MPLPAAVRSRSSVLALVVALLVTAAPGRAASRAVWVHAATGLRDVPGGEVLYKGLSGSLWSVPAGREVRLEARGGLALDLLPAETAWVYLLEDAARAEFEPPARVLLRSGREALVATDGSVPRLTAASDASLRGLKQPVRLRMVADARRPRPAAQPATAILVPRVTAVDPLIEQMLAELTQANYVATWQALDDFENRHTLAAQNNAAAQWILDRFRSFGLRADFHYYDQNGLRRNVIATLPGAVDSTRVVYICGHFDATSPTPTICAPGADDNASGTAAVIEAARVLSQRRFRYTIKFAAFNGEEQGLVGSSAYAASIAAAGEDVVGVFNCDMIAYRGTDAAPPDLVIYTDAASQPLATALADAISTYLAGLLEPVVHVEALAASDHASFWDFDYAAICSIEDEAWGSDFSPWYHTCDDRIERYPQDYPLHCARANLAAVALTAVPFDALAAGPVTVDDDAAGGSAGNGDGAANPTEIVELYVALRNVGPSSATGVSGILRSASPNVAVLDSTSAWNDIPSGGQAANLTAFRAQLAAGCVHGESLPFVLQMASGAGGQALGFSLAVMAPVLAYRAHVLDDTTRGNGNGVPDPGEVVLLSMVLANAGGVEATGVQAVMTTGSPHLTMLQSQAAAAAIAAAGQAALAPAYRVAISPDAVLGEDLALDLAITGAHGYSAETGLRLRVGACFFDDMEFDAGWSLAAPGDDATAGRWTRVDPIGTFVANQPAQPDDDHTPGAGAMCFVTGQAFVGAAANDGDVDNGTTTLTSPVLDLARLTRPRVTYWRWYTNHLGSHPNEDTWLVQVSADGGGTWVDLERTTSSHNAWMRRSFLLESYIVPSAQVVFRFVASDPPERESLVEAAVDDFEITGDLGAVAVGEVAAPQRLRLDAPHPNPAAGQVTMAFTLPAAGEASLELFGIDGRVVRTLTRGWLGAGAHRVRWDRQDDAGRPVAPGVYFLRLEAAGGTIERKVAVVQ